MVAMKFFVEACARGTAIAAAMFLSEGADVNYRDKVRHQYGNSLHSVYHLLAVVCMTWILKYRLITYLNKYMSKPRRRVTACCLSPVKPDILR
jgi:hypothetical protein